MALNTSLSFSILLWVYTCGCRPPCGCLILYRNWRSAPLLVRWQQNVWRSRCGLFWFDCGYHMASVFPGNRCMHIFGIKVPALRISSNTSVSLHFRTARFYLPRLHHSLSLGCRRFEWTRSLPPLTQQLHRNQHCFFFWACFSFCRSVPPAWIPVSW